MFTSYTSGADRFSGFNQYDAAHLFADRLVFDFFWFNEHVASIHLNYTISICTFKAYLFIGTVSGGILLDGHLKWRRAMGYYIDLSALSVDDLKKKLLTGDLLKSRMLLRENIESHFRAIKKSGVTNAGELVQALKSKKNTETFTQKTGIPLDYVTLLRREINSWLPQPRKIKDFPLIDDKVKGALLRIGIKTTIDLYNHILTPAGRKNLSSKTGVPGKQVERLARLTDFCRLQYVNETFATLLVEAGYVTIEMIVQADPEELQKKVNTAYKELLLSKCTIGLNDMRYLIRLAEGATSEIRW